MPFVEDHYHAIRRMVRRVGSRLCRDRGWSIDDLTGDVLLALVRKQETGSRYDPNRSTVDFYLRMVTYSVVSAWLDQRVPVTVELLEHDQDAEAEDMDVLCDERGLDDQELVRLTAVLVDARRVLVQRDDTAYRVLVAWLSSDDVDALATMAGLTRLDVLRYVAKHLSRLERMSQPRWRDVWKRHRARVYRQIKRARLGHSPPP